MYAILVAIWVALQLTRKSRLKAFKLAIVTFVVVGAGVYVLARHFYIPPGSPFPRLFLMFFMGAAFFVLKEYITLSRSLFWFFMIILSLAICNKHAFFVVYIFTIAYILFYVAYIPSGHIRQYNKAGDYSYGVYIYAFPVQQSIAALIPGVSVLQNDIDIFCRNHVVGCIFVAPLGTAHARLKKTLRRLHQKTYFWFNKWINVDALKRAGDLIFILTFNLYSSISEYGCWY